MKCPDGTPRHLKSYKFNQADPTIPYYCWTQLICATTVTEVNVLCQENTALGTTFEEDNHPLQRLQFPK